MANLQLVRLQVVCHGQCVLHTTGDCVDHLACDPLPPSGHRWDQLTSRPSTVPECHWCRRSEVCSRRSPSDKTQQRGMVFVRDSVRIRGGAVDGGTDCRSARTVSSRTLFCPRVRIIVGNEV